MRLEFQMVALRRNTKQMEYVMMEIIMLSVTLTEETAVDPMWTKHSALNVLVKMRPEFQMVALRRNTKQMEYVTMEIIMLGVTLMEETAVDPMWTKHSALNVPVKMRPEVLIAV